MDGSFPPGAQVEWVGKAFGDGELTPGRGYPGAMNGSSDNGRHALVRLEGLSKTYREGEHDHVILSDATASLAADVVIDVGSTAASSPAEGPACARPWQVTSRMAMATAISARK